MRYVVSSYAILVLVMTSLVAHSWPSPGPGRAPFGPTPFTNTSPLLTNTEALDRYKILADAPGMDDYDADLASLLGASHAGGARDSWATHGPDGGHLLIAEDYVGNGSKCRPTSVASDSIDPAVDRYDLTEIASAILSLAVAGSIENDDSYRAQARTRLLELTTITDLGSAFDPVTESPGAYQCVLDGATMAGPVVDAAMLLSREYPAGFSYADRLQVANWLATEVFPVASWGLVRANNWWGAAASAAVAISWFVEGPISSLTLYDGTTTTPAAFYAVTIDTLLAEWMSDSPGDELDSQCTATVWGVQPGGALPDEMRRSGGVSNCSQTDLEFADCLEAPGPWTSGCGGSSGAVFYSQKSAQLISRVCDQLLTIDDGDGGRCYELNVNGGLHPTLYDMIVASTTVETESAGDFRDVWTTDTTQGARWLAGQYYGINKSGVGSCMLEALTDGSVFIEGGNDVPYARITHANGVRHETIPAACGSTFVTMAESSLALAPDLQPRVPTMYNPGQVDTTDWTYYDATCKCNDVGCTAPVDAAAVACTAVTGIVDETGAAHTVFPLPSSFTHGPVPNDGVSEAAEIHRNLLELSMSDDQLLVFPDGVYIHNSGYRNDGAYGTFWRPTVFTDHRGFKGETRAGAIFRLRVGMYPGATMNRQFWVNGDDADRGANDGLAETAWTSGFAAGTTALGVTSSAGFAAGQRVRLDSDQGPTAGVGSGLWHATVTSVATGIINIDRPLPAEFGSTNGVVKQWTPNEEVVLRDFTLQVDPLYANHQSTQSGYITTRDSYHWETTNVELQGTYRGAVLVERSHDPYFERVDVVSPVGDKGPGDYSAWIAETSGGVYLNSRIIGTTGFAFARGVRNFAAIGNDIPGPLPACPDANGGVNVPQDDGLGRDGFCDSDGTTYSFDWECAGSFGDGGGNDCYTSVAAHQAIHGPVYPAATMNAACVGAGDPYPCCDAGTGNGTCEGTFLHCINDYGDTPAEGIDEVGDAWGWRGSASCHGVAAGAIYSCAEFHDFSGHGVIFARNSCGGPFWFDNSYGPGNGNWLFGNDFAIGAADMFGNTPGAQGEIHFRGVYSGDLPAGYENDAIISNNRVFGVLGSGSFGYNAYGNAVAATDNTVAETCQYRADADVTDPELNLLCSRSTDGSARVGINDIWEWNCIGDLEHDGAGCAYQSDELGGYTRTMPSLPFGSDWPFEFNPANTAPPFVGPDAPPGTCLPAKYRIDGSC